jgi:two-component system, NarL family, nitrate/nitrite response regulator NarL
MSAHQQNLHGLAIPRLLVVGDIALFREGIESGLARTGRFQIVGAVDVSEALSIVQRETIDVVVLDTSRRRASGQARQLLDVCPTLRIVAFGVDGVDDALACAEAGVRAFVGEDGSVDAITQAATIAAQGLSICPPELTALLLDRLAGAARTLVPRRHERLTGREDEIARMVATGLSNKQIARELSISPATVKNHVHAILGKFDLPRRSAIGRQLTDRGDQGRQETEARPAFELEAPHAFEHRPARAA